MGGSRRDLLRAGRRLSCDLSDGNEVLVEMLRGGALFSDNARNDNSPLADLSDSFGDRLQGGPGRASLLYTHLCSLPSLLHRLDRCHGSFLELLDHLLDLPRGDLGARCEVSHLIGDDRETTTLFASTCGFNSGIECQDIGLECNAIDDTDNVDNFLTKTNVIYLENIEVFTDDHWLLPEHNMFVNKGIKLETTKFDYEIRNNFSQPLVRWSLVASKEKVVSTRKYQKLPDLGPISIASMFSIFPFRISNRRKVLIL